MTGTPTRILLWLVYYEGRSVWSHYIYIERATPKTEKGNFIFRPLEKVGQERQPVGDISRTCMPDSKIRIPQGRGWGNLTCCNDARQWAHHTKQVDFPLQLWNPHLAQEKSSSLPPPLLCTWWPAVAPAWGRDGLEPRVQIKDSPGSVHCFSLILASDACFVGCIKLSVAKALSKSCREGPKLLP